MMRRSPFDGESHQLVPVHSVEHFTKLVDNFCFFSS